MRTIIPWTPDLAELYDMMGYETETPTQRWRAYRP